MVKWYAAALRHATVDVEGSGDVFFEEGGSRTPVPDNAFYAQIAAQMPTSATSMTRALQRTLNHRQERRQRDQRQWKASSAFANQSPFGNVPTVVRPQMAFAEAAKVEWDLLRELLGSILPHSSEPQPTRRPQLQIPSSQHQPAASLQPQPAASSHAPAPPLSSTRIRSSYSSTAPVNSARAPTNVSAPAFVPSSLAPANVPTTASAPTATRTAPTSSRGQSLFGLSQRARHRRRMSTHSPRHGEEHAKMSGEGQAETSGGDGNIGPVLAPIGEEVAARKSLEGEGDGGVRVRRGGD